MGVMSHQWSYETRSTNHSLAAVQFCKAIGKIENKRKMYLVHLRLLQLIDMNIEVDMLV